MHFICGQSENERFESRQNERKFSDRYNERIDSGAGAQCWNSNSFASTTNEIKPDQNGLPLAVADTRTVFARAHAHTWESKVPNVWVQWYTQAKMRANNISCDLLILTLDHLHTFSFFGPCNFYCFFSTSIFLLAICSLHINTTSDSLFAAHVKCVRAGFISEFKERKSKQTYSLNDKTCGIKYLNISSTTRSSNSLDFPKTI